MRLTVPVFATALALFAGAVSADDPAQASATARRTRIADKHVYEISGETDLPEGTVLDLTVIFLKHLPPIPNLPPEESKEYELEEIPVETGTARVTKGHFEQTLGYTVRAPYAGDYRLRFGLAKTVQPDELEGFVAAHTVSEEGWLVDFTIGDAAELEAQKAAVQKEVRADLLSLHATWQDLANRFKAAWPAATPDFAVWDQWLAGWEKSLLELEQRNGRRMDADIYWVESGGKRYIRYLIRELRIMQRDFRSALALLVDERDPYGAYLDQAGSFDSLLNRYLQNLGFGTMMDLAKVKAACDGIESALEAAVKAMLAPGATGASASAALATAQAAAISHLFVLNKEANEYGYAGIMELGSAVPSAFAACVTASLPSAPPESRASALEACDRARRLLTALRETLGVASH